MELARQLIEQALHLISYQGLHPDRAALARAISASYYALFHLLAEDAASRWNGSPAANTGIQRALDHGAMRRAAEEFTKPKWKDWHGVEFDVPTLLGSVAEAFLRLQMARTSADYNPYTHWTAHEAENTVDIGWQALASWDVIRLHPLAGDFLLSMLIGRKR